MKILNENFVFKRNSFQAAYALGGGSSGKCYLCSCTISQFNNIDYLLEKATLEENEKLGISSLHARIRAMEFVLKVSSKRFFQKYSVSLGQNNFYHSTELLKFLLKQ